MAKDSPRQIVTDAVTFEGPARIPRDLWVLPAALARHGRLIRELQAHRPSDFAGDGFEDLTGGDALYRRGTFRDAWGSVWENQEEGLLGQVRSFPLSDWSLLKTYTPPFHLIGKGFEKVPGTLAATRDRFHIGIIPSLFHRMCWLRDPADILMDFYTNPGELALLRDMVHEYNLRHLDQLLEYDHEGIFIGDDWGTQEQLFIRPEMWREYFKPCYAEYFSRARKAGRLAFFHSDGYILEIIEDLIEIGVQALNCQVACMGAEELGRRFAGRICFWGELDRQHLLPLGRPEEITRAARDNMRHLMTDRGGYIMQAELNMDVPEENIRALFSCYDFPGAA